jgi:MFS family permease
VRQHGRRAGLTWRHEPKGEYTLMGPSDSLLPADRHPRRSVIMTCDGQLGQQPDTRLAGDRTSIGTTDGAAALEEERPVVATSAGRTRMSALLQGSGPRSTFRSLRIRNYRLFWLGQLVSLAGTWMQRVAQDWLVLNLTHNNGVALGITTTLQFLPYLLVSVPGGLLADRYSKRRILLTTQATMCALALALGVLDITDVLRLWHVYAIAACLGVAAAVDSPVRQAFVIELVGARDLTNAVSLNSASFNVGRVLGPLAAGALIAWAGTPVVFLLNSISFLAVIAGLLLMDPAQISTVARRTGARRQLSEGFRYVAQHGDMLAPAVLVSVVATFGMNNLPIVMGIMARATFHSGARGFGLLSTSFAAGGLIGTIVSARLARPRYDLLVLSGLAFGALECLAAGAPNYAFFSLALGMLGIATYLVITSANSAMQLASPDYLRGRVMAVYLIAFFGPTPVGALVLGYGSNALGPRAALLIAGAFSTAVTGAAVLVLRRSVRRAP